MIDGPQRKHDHDQADLGSGRAQDRSLRAFHDRPEADECIRGIVAELVRDPSIFAAKSPGTPSLTADREKRIALSARLEAFATGFALGQIAGAQLAKAAGTVEAELANVDARLASGLSQSVSSPVLGTPDLGQAFAHPPIDVQRAAPGSVLRASCRSSPRPVARIEVGRQTDSGGASRVLGGGVKLSQ